MRYWITDPDQYTEHYIHTDKYIAENSGDFIIEVMPVEDHDRVVAELKAQLEHSETKVGWLLRDNEKNVREHDRIVAELKADFDRFISKFDKCSKAYDDSQKTIAKQEKVIEKLKEELIDVYEGHRFDVDEMLERVAAIERGEA